MDIKDEFPEIDAQGKRFRRVGTHCIEYAPMIIEYAEAKPPEPPKPRKDCPFRGGLRPECPDSCSFCAGGVCRLGEAQRGKRCAINNSLTCGESCTMYNNGCCTLFAAGRN